MSFFNELKRRNVFKAGIAYIVVAWLLMQVADIILNNVEAPDWVFHVILLLMAIGLPLIMLFAWAFEMTPEGLKREREVDRSRSITTQTGRKLDYAIICVLVVALAYFSYDKFVLSSERDTSPPEAVTQTVTKQAVTPPEPSAQAEKSIAVLAFVNMSSDPEQEYFADGIAEEILNSLARVRELKVAGRTSSFAFKGRNEDLHAIGKVLRVNYILEGSVRKSGTRVRITAQLIKVEDGFHMWSETYDREMDDIFAIQDEISAAILVQLKAQLLGEQQPATAQTDTRAYDLYLLAKQRIYDRTQPSLEMAEKLLNEAISIDAGYAPAFAQLGIATLLLSDRNYGTVPHEQAGERAKRYLDEALLLAPQNAEALAGMGLYFMNHGLGHQKPVELLQQALAINPNMVNANTWLANELDTIGQLRAALQIREQTFQRDPLHGPTFGNLQQKYMVMGQSEKALEMLESLRAYLPGDAGLIGNFGQVYLMSGRLADAREQLQLAFDKEPLYAVNRWWYGFALFSAREYELMATIAPDFLAPLALSRLGRPEEALILGNQAVGGGVNPTFYFQALVENGRFAQLIEALESRWSSLDGFSTDRPGGNGYGYNAMGFIAQAYRQLGKQAKFDDAMLRFKAALERQIAEGADNWRLNFSRAHHAVLANDYDAAISLLEKAFQQGAYLDTVSETAWPVFKPLNGDPRYEAAKAAMVKRLDEELKKMDLEPQHAGSST